MVAALSLLWFPLAATARQLADWTEWLDAHERARAARFVHPAHGERYIAAHAHLRFALAQRLACAPAAVVFARGEHGKPLVAGGPHFNLSHSGGLGLIGLHSALELGVDIEAVDRTRDWLALARRFYTPAEFAWLAALPAPDLPLAFCRLWTVKEAWMKALGRGLAAGAANLEVAFAPGAVTARDLVHPKRAWWTRSLDVAPGAAAAVVAQAEPEGLTLARLMLPN